MNAQVLFDLAKKKELKEYPIIKCAAGEKILCVQRQHPITLIAPLVLPIIIFSLALLSLVFLTLLLPQTFPLLTPTLTLYITLTMFSLLLLIETFTFMTWYYQFYIITNKAIVHRYSFRIASAYSEAVFGEKMHVQDIVRNPPNLLYDFLKIQDVYVYFHKLEREEPFIFKTPEDAQKIEDIIQDLITQTNHEKGKS